jgi:23S rRNA (cytosine1962-C5)-methyltransferase
MKLEQVGPFRIKRPSASAVWGPTLSQREWDNVDAVFERRSDGGGDWNVKNPDMNKPWLIQVQGVSFQLKLTGFGHLGIFSEQEKNWVQLREIIQSEIKKKNIDPTGKSIGSSDTFRVLNLFAYTGGSSLFSAQAGAEVVHIDASKSSVAWAKENAAASGLESKPIRWIVEDVQEFVKKEIRREKTYHGIILDPPSYGRGNKNQVWKIEDHLMPLLKDIKSILAEDFSFILLSAHSPGYTPVSLENQLKQIFISTAKQKEQVEFDSGEMLIFDQQKNALPSGAYSLLKMLVK